LHGRIGHHGGPGAGAFHHDAEPFLSHTGQELVFTIGLVFISFAGPVKVASISEEVRDPDRNLPLGMFLALLTAWSL